MNIEQIYTGCLAHGAYYITSDGEAAIIDPLRDIQPYLNRLQKDGVKLKYIFETHFHADFVSGHLDLKEKTGAQIVYGPTAQPSFDAIVATDGQEFSIGKVTIKAIHTPGHTMESTTYLLMDENGNQHAIFSGDTLFLGDVGRPDLAQKAASMTQEELAGLLYDSLYKKILPLPDDIIVYPGHGAGSACGKFMMKETVDSLGHQKKMNYALNQPSKEAFIEAVLDGLTAAPGYFGMAVYLNKNGYAPFDNVLANGLKALDANEFESLSKNAKILDTRPCKEFAAGFVPTSINIGMTGNLGPWVGEVLVDVKLPILLVTDQGKEEETVTRLSRVGFDNVLGYLKGGIAAWKEAEKPLDKVDCITAEEFEKLYNENTKVMDVRKPTEYNNEHVLNSVNRPLQMFQSWVSEVDQNEHFYLHCHSGYRSMIVASLLLSHGIKNFTEIAGGYMALSKTTVPKTK